MKNHEDILNHLKQHADELEIPKSIQPEQMKKWLKQQQAKKAAEKKKRTVQRSKSALAVAAGICIVAGMIFAKSYIRNQEIDSNVSDLAVKEHLTDVIMDEAAEAGMKFPKITYEDIYVSMEKVWKEQTMRFDVMEDGVMMEDAAEEAPAAEYSTMAAGSEEKQMNAAADEFGTTNVQTAGVDEGDIVKNDGRYLYQKVWNAGETKQKQSIQIVDTQDGLTKASEITDFDSIDEFYVWEDVLVTIENKYLDYMAANDKRMIAYKDVVYFTNYFHEISFFNISDFTKPEKINTLTLQGRYASSRIADGFFYGFSKYYANEGNGAADYDAYVPKINGVRMRAEDIYLPAENVETSYLVLIAVNLKNPTEFTDTTGIVAGSDLYYVSANNIYVADSKTLDIENEWNNDSTEILRFSYEKGKFTLRAIGEIKGTLHNSFSIIINSLFLRGLKPQDL